MICVKKNLQEMITCSGGKRRCRRIERILVVEIQLGREKGASRVGFRRLKEELTGISFREAF